ncbi:hypothetical protein [Streptomyces sp. NPDC060188]|uniref:hypothetical protein n=1 Tax=Streptomyces sp. NPDC060188 TaxID=3347068 RepID=UPI003647499C
MKAAQAKANAVAASLAEAPDGPYLVVAVTDPVTGNRLRTFFVTYEVPVPQLHLVAS